MTCIETRLLQNTCLLHMECCSYPLLQTVEHIQHCMANIDLLHFENMLQQYNQCMLEVHLKICIFQPDNLCMILLAYIFQDHKKENSMMLRRVNQQERFVLPDMVCMTLHVHQNTILLDNLSMTYHHHWKMSRHCIPNTVQSYSPHNDLDHNRYTKN